MVYHKMDRELRAKQFMPFAALKGYEEALRRKEKVTVPRPDLSEEYQEEVDRTLRMLKKGDMASVIYFHRGEYLKVTGMISRIDAGERILDIARQKIPFGDIFGLEYISGECADRSTDGEGYKKQTGFSGNNVI